MNDKDINAVVVGGVGIKKSNGGTQYYQQDRVYAGEVTISLSTSFNPYYVTKTDELSEVGTLNGGKWDRLIESSRRVYDSRAIAPAVVTQGGGNQEVKTLLTDLRIRKLTPRECWRLMGFSERTENGTWIDTAFEKAEKVNSNAQLYKQAGNSIVVQCLEGILTNLLIENNQEVYKQTSIFDFL